MPQVSVILPNYNHGEFLERRIQSILNQSYQDFEIILLDDCSSDNSLEILKKYKNHPKVSCLIVNEINSGNPFRQWEKGVQLAKGELIWIAESDDVNADTYLEESVPFFYKESNLGIVHVKTQFIDKDDNPITPNKYHIELYNDLSATQFFYGIDYINNFLIKKNTIINASGAVFKKSIFLETISVNKEIKYGGDWLIYLFILLQSNVIFINKVLSFRRFHQESHTKKINQSWIDEHILIRENFKRHLAKKGISNVGIFNQNISHIQNLYGMKSIQFAREKRPLKALNYLFKVSLKTFPSFLRHNLYWLLKK